MIYGKGTTDLPTIFKGRLKRIETQEFVTLILTTEDNQEKRFLWFRQFPGSQKYTSDLNNLIGKQLSIGAKEIEVFIPAAHDYYKINEVTSLEVL